MAATLNDIVLMMRSERLGIPASVPVKRSVVDLSQVNECPPDATAMEVLLHCMRPIKK